MSGTISPRLASVALAFGCCAVSLAGQGKALAQNTQPNNTVVAPATMSAPDRAITDQRMQEAVGHNNSDHKKPKHDEKSDSKTPDNTYVLTLKDGKGGAAYIHEKLPITTDKILQGIQNTVVNGASPHAQESVPEGTPTGDFPPAPAGTEIHVNLSTPTAILYLTCETKAPEGATQTPEEPKQPVVTVCAAATITVFGAH